MEAKKNPKADVSRNGSIYFAVGLALMLFLTYTTINYKTYDKSLIDIGQLDLDADLDEEIPLIDQIKPPPRFRAIRHWQTTRYLFSIKSEIVLWWNVSKESCKKLGLPFQNWFQPVVHRMKLAIN